MRAWDVDLGRTARRPGHREQLRRRSRRALIERRASRRSTPTGGSRSATRARTAAKRSTPSSACRSGPLADLRHAFRARRLPGRRPRVRASSTSTASTETPDRLRPAADRRGHGLRRDVRRRDGEPALRRRPASASTASTSRKSTGRVTGAAWVGVGRQLLVRRRRHADPRRVAGHRCRSRARRCRGSCSSPPAGTGTFDDAALRRAAARRRPVRGRRRHRPGHRDACRCAARC